MAFLESPRFPECVSLGALAKPRYKTHMIMLASGAKRGNIEWANAIHSFDFTHGALDQTQHDALLNFFHAIQGRGNQFRVKDYSDYFTTAANGVLVPLVDGAVVGTVGLGYGVGGYTIAKLYSAGALTTFRFLQKPVIGTTVIYRNGSALTVGVGAGNIALSSTNGQVTFVADQTRAISSHAVGGVHQITLASAFSPNVVAGDLVYISGITGTAATLINNKRHEVQSVASAVISLILNTTGLTATGGTASLYPQEDDVLTVVTEFDVPCRFSNDEATFESFEKNLSTIIYRWSGINLEEERIDFA